jgi:hypothetical protein
VVKTGEVADPAALSSIEAALMVATMMAVATSSLRIMLHTPVPMLRILFAMAGHANRQNAPKGRRIPDHSHRQL